MKMSNSKWGGLLRAAAVLIALLFVPAGAYAHGIDDRAPLASDCVAATQSTAGYSSALDCCTLPASGQGLHCHLASAPAMATGQNPSLDDDQPVKAATAVLVLVIQGLDRHSAPAAHIPIAALPRFILFGNFRS